MKFWYVEVTSLSSQLRRYY